jgi:hypothetical protein
MTHHNQIKELTTWFLTFGTRKLTLLGNESSDLIQIEGYLNSRQGFDLKDIPNLERFKTIPKIGKWKFGCRNQIQTYGLKPRIF